MWAIIAVALAALVGVLYLVEVGQHAGSVFNTTTISAQISDLQELINNIRGGYADSPDFSSLTPTAAIDAGWVPGDMVDGTTIVSQFGGTVTLSVNSSNSSEFDVVLPEVPAGQACEQVIEGVAGSGSAVVGVSIGGSAVTLPIDPAALATDCAASSSSTTESIDFTVSH